jgi:heme exporter protein A
MSHASRLVLEGVSCQRGGRILFSSLSCIVEAGGVLVLTGANGAGKTSLIRIIAGLLTPQSGEIRLLPDEAGIPIAEQAHLLGARDGLKAAETVLETLTLWHAVLGAAPDRIVATAMAAYGLSPLAHLACGDLSSGQRKRVALARLLLTPTANRPLWLLDEPLNALDRQAQAMLDAQAASHRAAGGLIVVATHADLGWSGCTALRIG